jgi:transposase
MKTQVLYVGIDVDDKHFHLAGFNKETGEYLQNKIKPTSGSLLKILRKFEAEGFKVKCCYEATYCGYGLQRTISKNGFEIDIIAPSSILKQAGNRIKTDRIDAQILAEQLANNQLRKIHIPTEMEQNDRSLIRSRTFLVDLRKSLRQHILSLCRMSDLNYRSETGAKGHWTSAHLFWLITKINGTTGSIRNNFEFLMKQLEYQDRSIEAFDLEIEKLSETEKYKIQKDSLLTFRGIKTLTAMKFITELGDIRRFPHPTKITSYAGMDLIEYSSGGKDRRFGITKMGNTFLRTAAIEACQSLDRGNVLSVALKKRREGKDPKIIEIAEKCQKRLKKRANHLLDMGKTPNKVKVACAREFLGFVWAVLTKVA